MKIDENIDLITRAAVQIYSKEGLMQRLSSGKKLKIKLGADPSRPDLHLGHSVVLRQLKRFQDMGHEVIFVIGDFTGMIGDPTGKSKTRPKLTLEQTRESGRSYFTQVTKILDPDKTIIEYNSKWLDKMTFSDIISLSSKYTLARMLERNDFSERFKENLPLSLHELLYPLAQGYDSVAIHADVEVGGTDQTFNLLVGRDLQRDYGQMPQEVITFPLLIGLDGVEKMSKSLNNYIGIDEPPEIMYEKAMKIPDSLLYDYFRLTTDLPLDDAAGAVKHDIIGAHSLFGKTIVQMYHGEDKVSTAVQRYDDIASGEIPDRMNEVQIFISELSAENKAEGCVGICDLLRLAGLAASNSEARRLIQGNGIKINNILQTDIFATVGFKDGIILSRGKNSFVKLSFVNTPKA